MVALGAMNMAGSCASCYITSGNTKLEHIATSSYSYYIGCHQIDMLHVKLTIKFLVLLLENATQVHSLGQL
ncbi:hypothetical protein B296_00027823 [Ensete ventricosum]|uniref:Uncharacterized protein n=1 Tax=Ensete ventricosum TaxID=4639 RepID=A0A427ADT6_ENSVE|nr:hypothetical protein B296_00027823 [Ensete ventricosum]